MLSCLRLLGWTCRTRTFSFSSPLGGLSEPSMCARNWHYLICSVGYVLERRWVSRNPYTSQGQQHVLKHLCGNC